MRFLQYLKSQGEPSERFTKAEEPGLPSEDFIKAEEPGRTK